MVLQQTPLTYSFSQNAKNLSTQVGSVLTKIYNDFNSGSTLHLYEEINNIANVDKGDFENTQLRHYKDSYLYYDGQTVNFTSNTTLTGQTSGAKALIVGDGNDIGEIRSTVSWGTTGILTLKNVSGTFQNDEEIRDNSDPSTYGIASVNGTITVNKYLVTKLDDTLYKTQWTAL
jgi:hypothetical protein